MTTNPAIIVAGCVLLVLSLMFGLPVWSVWQQGLKGEAELARAQQSRQIAVAQALAEREAATARAEVSGTKNLLAPLPKRSERGA